MLLTKIKLISAVLLLVGVLTIGVGATIRAAQTEPGGRANAQREDPKLEAPVRKAQPAQDDGKTAGRPPVDEPKRIPVEEAKRIQEKTAVIQERVDELTKKVQALNQQVQFLEKSAITWSKELADLRAEKRATAELAVQRVDELTKHVQVLTQQVAFLEKSAIISSKELAELRAEKKTAAELAAQKAEIFIFTLKNADANELSATLRQLLQDDAKGASKKLRIAMHESTNSLLVQGTRQDRETIEAIVRQLDELPVRKKETKNKKE